MGISTHNVVLIAPEGTQSADKIFVAMVVNDPKHGFAPGRLSISYEGQMDPTKDVDSKGTPSTHQTVLRTLAEEFGMGLNQSSVRVNLGDILLVAVCAERGSAYTSWCHIIWVKSSIPDFVSSYQLAPRRKDADSLLAVPLEELDHFIQRQINYARYQPYIQTGSLAENAALQLHPTAAWRVDALKDYLQYLGIS